MPAYEEPIAAVTLRRGPCFGSCPVYEVTLAAPAQRHGPANGSWTGPASIRPGGRGRYGRRVVD
jgi:hypothetical protein